MSPEGQTATPTTPTAGTEPAGTAPTGHDAAASSNTASAPSDWRAALPEALREDPALASFKDVAALAKSYREAVKMIGGSIRIPGPNATPEEVAAFRAKLGVPESPEGYRMDAPPEVAPLLDGEVLDRFKQAAHRLGVPATAVEGLWRWYLGELRAQQRGVAQMTKQVAAQLREEWGDALFERNVALAQRTVREFGGEELIEFLDATGLGNHPGLVKLFARVGHLLAEDGHVPGDVEGIVTPEAARQRIAEIMSNPEHPYHRKNYGKPGHEEAVAEVSRLFQLAYPSA